MSRPLRVRLVASDELTEERLRQLWRLRLEMLTLTRSEDQDWAEFRSAVVGPDRFVFVFDDPEGAAQGFFTIAMLPVDAGRRRMLLMFSKYFYFRRAYRGHPKTIIAPWLLLPIGLRRHGPRTLHFVTTAYPQSYVSLTRTSGRTWSLRDEDAPSHVREALTQFGEAFYPSSFDAEDGVVRGGNVADSESLPQAPDAQALVARYEQLNPGWRDGVSLPIFFTVDPRLVWTSGRRSLRRLARRARP